MSGHFPLGDIHPFKYFYGLSCLLGVVFSFILPDSEQSTWLVFLQWQLQTFIPITALIFSYYVLSLSNWVVCLNPWLKVGLSGLMGTLMYAPFALALDTFLLGEKIEQGWGMAMLNEWAAVLFPVLIVWFLLNSPWILGLEYKKVRDAEQTDDELADNSPMLTLAGLTKFSDIAVMVAELHYLDVITANGHNLILYSLKQAINEMPDELGMQVHRSYWVAYDNIECLQKNGRQGVLTLKLGGEIPVSRSFLKKLQSHQLI